MGSTETTGIGEARGAPVSSVGRRQIRARHNTTQNENPPRISPGGPTSFAPSPLPVHPWQAAVSRTQGICSRRLRYFKGVAEKSHFRFRVPLHSSRIESDLSN